MASSDACTNDAACAVEATRLATIVNDLLDISWIETGRLTLRYENVSLTDLLMGIINKMHLVMRDFQVVLHHMPRLLLYVDPNRIEQVFVNLLTNAAKHAPQGSTIIIQAKQERRQNVSATRRKEKLPIIFGKYYQAEENPSGGFGLGLYIAKEIIEAHKGNVWV